jgi:hypothetical protein
MIALWSLAIPPVTRRPMGEGRTMSGRRQARAAVTRKFTFREYAYGRVVTLSPPAATLDMVRDGFQLAHFRSRGG